MLFRSDSIPHVKTIRIHTRVPVAAPERIDTVLIGALTRLSKPVYVGIHCNHAAELTPDVKDACARLAGAGIPLLAQTVLLKGVNDTDADARRVVALLAHLNAKVNLIALNPGPEIPFETPTPDRVASFQQIIRRSMPCFIRKPRGLDVFAACGQLKRMELLQIQ